MIFALYVEYLVRISFGVQAKAESKKWGSACKGGESSKMLQVLKCYTDLNIDNL